MSEESTTPDLVELVRGAFAAASRGLHDVHDAGSRVVGLVEMTGRSKDSGIQTRQQMGLVYADFRDGMIGEVRYFSTWQQALKAVGLEA
jgi:hypothetical protein